MVEHSGALARLPPGFSSGLPLGVSSEEGPELAHCEESRVAPLGGKPEL